MSAFDEEEEMLADVRRKMETFVEWCEENDFNSFEGINANPDDDLRNESEEQLKAWGVVRRGEDESRDESRTDDVPPSVGSPP